MNLPKNAWNSEQPPKKNSASILIYSTARMKCMFCVYEFALFFICDWIAIIQIDMYLKIHITISEFKWFACENFHFYLNVLSLWIFMNFSNSTFRRIKFHLKFTILTIGAFVKISLSVFRLILFAFSFRISLAIDKMHMSLLLLLFFFAWNRNGSTETSWTYRLFEPLCSHFHLLNVGCLHKRMAVQCIGCLKSNQQQIFGPPATELYTVAVALLCVLLYFLLLLLRHCHLTRSPCSLYLLDSNLKREGETRRVREGVTRKTRNVCLLDSLMWIRQNLIRIIKNSVTSLISKLIQFKMRNLSQNSA